MKHLKVFEDFNEDAWDDIISQYDVYQLYELLVFKYGEVFTETKIAIDEYEDYYNPDHIYEIIESELKSLGHYDDFVTNYEQYGIEKDEADPFHWRHRKKNMDQLSKSFDKRDDEIKF